MCLLHLSTDFKERGSLSDISHDSDPGRERSTEKGSVVGSVPANTEKISVGGVEG